MGIADFAAGWTLGAKTGNQGFDEIVATTKAILQSKEFNDFAAAMRAHAAHALHELGDLVDSGTAPAITEDLIEVVRSLVQRRETPK